MPERRYTFFPKRPHPPSMSASGERYNPYTIVIILKRIKNEKDITNQIYLKLSHQIASLIVKRNLFDMHCLGVFN